MAMFAILFTAVFVAVEARASPAPYNNRIQHGKTPFSIEEAALGGFQIRSFSGKWVSDVELEYQDNETKDIRLFNVDTNETSIRLGGHVLKRLDATKYRFSPSGKFVLIAFNESSVFRHTKTAQYAVYSIDNGKYYFVAQNETIHEAGWGGKNSTLLYIKDNNIYVITEINEAMEAIQITTSGVPGILYNGLSDWVYEEEVLASAKAYWFSPSGEHLLYLTLDDTRVNEVTMLEYGEPGSADNQYPKPMKIRYPKTGSQAPNFQLWHVSLKDPSKRTLFAKSDEDIFYNLKWANDKIFFYLVTNRVQNESRTHSCNVGNPNTCVLTFQDARAHGWTSILLPKVSDNLDRFIRMMGLPVENYGNFTHLALFYLNGTARRLTNGFKDVQEILFWDQTNRIVYFSAPEERQSTTQHVYAVSEEPNGKKPECLTCQVYSPEGRPCTFLSATFSTKGSYLIVTCNGPDPKTVYLYKSEIPLGRPLRLLENNEKLRNNLKTKLYPEILNLTVQIKGPLYADVRLLLPPNIDTSGRRKYPLVIYVYGGPESKAITDAFKLDWGLYMTTNMSVIYGVIDGRNTQKKGENMLFAGYRALGTVEVSDQLKVTWQLQMELPFIDPQRTGIWGWSYGGYLTTKVLEKDVNDIFKCGIAVAPVVDWLYYDSVYTERYMGLPSENMAGYEKSSALKNVKNLQNKKFLLIHGNADDNVHYQNAMMLARALEKNNIPFELMSYPDENHSLLGVRKHLYHTMEKFWNRCFNLKFD